MSATLQLDQGQAVQPTGDRMVFLCVSSRNPSVRYRVDLTANEGAGHCQCVDFSVRRQPALDAGSEPWGSATTCRHLRQVGRYFLRDVLSAMAKSESERP